MREQGLVDVVSKVGHGMAKGFERRLAVAAQVDPHDLVVMGEALRKRCEEPAVKPNRVQERKSGALPFNDGV